MRDQHPFLWAAFFAAGDPSSLDGKPAAPQLDTKMPTYDPPAGNLPPGSGSSCGCELAPTRSEPALWLLALPLTLLVRRRRS